MQNSAEYNKPVYMTFIDFEKAFGTVSTTSVLGVLKDQGIEETYTRPLDDIYKGFGSAADSLITAKSALRLSVTTRRRVSLLRKVRCS